MLRALTRVCAFTHAASASGPDESRTDLAVVILTSTVEVAVVLTAVASGAWVGIEAGQRPW